MKSRLYFDHNAATGADPRVLERFVEVERDVAANGGSLHAEGRRARSLIEAERRRVADALAVNPDEIIFLSGGTEANNTVVLGCGDPSRPILMGDVEHPSIAEPARQRGVERWRVDATGCVEVVLPSQPIGLICLVHGQSEVGTVQPVAAAAEAARAAGVPLHVDASQSIGRIPIAAPLELADTFTVSGHKLGGLKGCGVLVVRDRVRERLQPALSGGGQERGLRAGTPAQALIAATARAIELAVGEMETRARSMQAARRAFLSTLRELPMRVITPIEQALPNTVMIQFAGIDGRLLLPALDMEGVAVSQGSACSSGSPEPPRVLRAIGLEDDEARQCVRVSFAHTTTESEARDGAQRVANVVSRLRSTSKLR